MKHVLLILIMWLATLCVDAQQLQKAVINDPDGYTNVRKGQGSGTAIVGRINDGEVFYVQKLSNNSWWPVYLQKNGTRLGYMHKSRVSILGKEASSASSSTKGFVQGTYTKDVERFNYSYPISFTFKNGKVTYNESNGELVIVGKYSQIYPGVLRVTFNDVVKGSLGEYGLYSHKISYNIAWSEEKEDGRRYIEIQDWDGNGSLFGWIGRIYLTGPNAYKKAKKVTQTASDNKKDYQWVDLGLPSGNLWAVHNIGASTTKDIGDYYSWGELSVKVGQYVNGTYSLDRTFLGNDISGTKYDVASQKWGTRWQMPSKQDVDELLNHCTWKTATIDGVTGTMGTSPNGKTIFFPPSGYIQYGLMNTVPLIWTCTYVNTDNAWAGIMEVNCRTESFARRFGLPVRPVKKKSK